MHDDYVALGQAARDLGVPQYWIYERVRHGTLPGRLQTGVRAGQRFEVRRSDYGEIVRQRSAFERMGVRYHVEPGPCSDDGCDRQTWVAGRCQRHYMRDWRRKKRAEDLALRAEVAELRQQLAVVSP